MLEAKLTTELVEAQEQVCAAELSIACCRRSGGSGTPWKKSSRNRSQFGSLMQMCDKKTVARNPPFPVGTGSIAPVHRFHLTSWATSISMLPIFSVMFGLKDPATPFSSDGRHAKGFHKAITKDLKLPKGAEFKTEFRPSKRTTMKKFKPEAIASQRAELDAYFGELAELSRKVQCVIREEINAQ